MLTLAPCPHCATRVPEDGAFCDSCGKQLAACPTCGELAKPGEKCIKHGVAAAVRPPVAASAKPVAPVAPVATPTVMPPPRRAAPPSAPPSAAPAGTVAPAVPNSPGQTPYHGNNATTVQSLVLRLQLMVTSGDALAPLAIDSEVVIGRGEGPFAMMLDQFHNKGVSRRHCLFRRGPTGDWSLVDLAGKGSCAVSPDGSFSGAPISPMGSQRVEPGRDHVKIGLLTFRVEPAP